MPLEKVLTTHCSCVQTAVNAVNWSPARETRKLPFGVATSAALPVEASGELASMVSVMAPLDTLEFMMGRFGNVLVAEVVEPPPHPVSAEAAAASDRI